MAAGRAAAHLAGPALRILDIGADRAIWSLALARRDPTCRVTVVDWPERIARATRGAVRAAGCVAQYVYLGGDPLALDWGGQTYELAILGFVCQTYEEPEIRRLLRRILPALRFGGRLAILEVLPNERLDGPTPALRYARDLARRAPSGRLHPFSAYAGWLRATGYEHIERFDLSEDPPASLIAARRPR
jgi:hypothetical protein